MTPKVLVLLLVITSCASSLAADRPAVKVEFQLKEPSYRAQFANSIPRLENRITSELVRALTDRVGFVAFGTASAPNVIHFCLVGQAGTSSLREVGFSISLTTPSGSLSSYWQFRPAEAYISALGDEDAFVEEVRLKIAGADYDKMIQQMFSSIPISQQAVLIQQNDPEWVVPFRQNELCIDLDSRVAIQAKVTTKFATKTRSFVSVLTGVFEPADSQFLPDYRESILADLSSTENDASAVNELKSAAADQVQTVAVFIKQYRRLDRNCNSAVSSSSAFGSSE